MNPTSSSQALEQLQGFRTNRKNPMDILQQSETRLGLPSARDRLVGLRGAISNTENLLRNVDPSVTGRTQGSLVTEAQRAKIVSNERQPYAEQFREQSRALEGETSNVNELAQRSMSETQLGVGEQNSQEQYLQNLYQTLFGREQEDEEKRRWEEQQKQYWADFNERKRQADAQAGALAAQTEALKRAYATSNAPMSTGGGQGGYAPGTSPEEVRAVAETARKNTPSTFSLKNIGNAINSGYVKNSALRPIAQNGPLALLGKGWLW